MKITPIKAEIKACKSITDPEALQAEISAYLTIKSSMLPLKKALARMTPPPKGKISGDEIIFSTKK